MSRDDCDILEPCPTPLTAYGFGESVLFTVKRVGDLQRFEVSVLSTAKGIGSL